MADMERVTIALPTPMADSLRAAVEAGEYATTSEVVRDALRLWEARRELRAKEVAVLKRAWDDGLASGTAQPLDIESIISSAKAQRKTSRRRG